MRPISKLQFITTNAATAEQACMGGVDWIQLRLKDISYEDYKKVALEVQAVCKRYNATFIVNDNIKLALDINADGVHVGKEDSLPQADIDAMLARGGIIGVTTNDINDFQHLQGKPVSYVGLGPYRYTDTKKKLSPILGIEGYQQLLAAIKERGMTPPPIVGIGGITGHNVQELLSTGLHGIAVSGAIANAADVTEAAKRLTQAVQNNEKR
jgi:thiamine-phosphate pyrophosphorylase